LKEEIKEDEYEFFSRRTRMNVAGSSFDLREIFNLIIVITNGLDPQ
jgi:hypothetical protein